ncbi:unnamed protein product, partial [Cylicostephanus goldi]
MLDKKECEEKVVKRRLPQLILGMARFNKLFACADNIYYILFQWYVEAIGMVSLLVEASLGAPQLIRNWQRKSTQGMSVPMVLAWLTGDLAKTAYFVAT